MTQGAPRQVKEKTSPAGRRFSPRMTRPVSTSQKESTLVKQKMRTAPSVTQTATKNARTRAAASASARAPPAREPAGGEPCSGIFLCPGKQATTRLQIFHHAGDEGGVAPGQGRNGEGRVGVRVHLLGEDAGGQRAGDDPHEKIQSVCQILRVPGPGNLILG